MARIGDFFLIEADESYRSGGLSSIGATHAPFVADALVNFWTAQEAKAITGNLRGFRAIRGSGRVGVDARARANPGAPGTAGCGQVDVFDGEVGEGLVVVADDLVSGEQVVLGGGVAVRDEVDVVAE